MPTGATGQLGLALPVQGELSGTWGNTVNNAITEYTNIAIAATLTLTNDGAVTLANTTGTDLATNITSSLTGAGTVTAQFAIVRVTGTLTTTKVVTFGSAGSAPYSKTYVVVNAATGGSVSFTAYGGTGVTIAVGESAWVYFNGTNIVKIASTTSGAAGGSNTQVQFNSSGALAGSSALTFDGSNLSTTGQVLLENNKYIGFKNTTGTYAASIFNDTSNFLNLYNSGNTGTIFYTNAAEQMRLNSTGLCIGTTSATAKLTVINTADANKQIVFGDNATYYGSVGHNSGNGLNEYRTEASGGHGFFIGTSGTANLLINSSGNVGIGTSSPAYKLDLYTTAQFSGRWANATRAGYLYTDSGGPGIFNTAAYGSEGMYLNAASNYIQFVTNSVESMRISSQGYVGIGTTSPNRLLSLYATQPVFQITNVASGNTQGTIQYQASGATDFILDNQGSGSGGNIIFQQAGAERFRFGTAGQLGIGGATYGSSGQVLTSGGASAAPTWASPAGGGSWIYLSTVTASNSATVDIETTFDSTYQNYVIVAAAVKASSSGQSLLVRQKQSGTYRSADYYWHLNQSYTQSSSYQGSTANPGTSYKISDYVSSSSSDQGVNLVMYVLDPANSTTYKGVFCTGYSNSDNANVAGMNCTMLTGVGQNSTAALTGIRFFMGSGNIASGTFRLYGIKNS